MFEEVLILEHLLILSFYADGILLMSVEKNELSIAYLTYVTFLISFRELSLFVHTVSARFKSTKLTNYDYST